MKLPEAGIRISKIKSLEDDIALSLSALEFVLLRLFQERNLESKFLIKNDVVSMKSVIVCQISRG
jgi:hypothetical protein